MTFIAACVLCGALAVPWHPLTTPVAAAVGGLLAGLALRVRNWARLQDARTSLSRAGLSARIVESLVWFGVGLAIGLVLLAIIRLVVEPSLPAAGARIAAAGTLPVWRRLIIIYVAAVGEELVFRVFLLSLVAGLVVRLIRAPNLVPSPAVLWTATVVAALAFGAVHLPAWSSIGLTASVAALVMSFNFLGGLVVGYAFFSRGILAAVCAHAGADCAIQLIGPLTG